LRDILHTGDMAIRLLDEAAGVMIFPYTFENGQRVSTEPQPITQRGFSWHVIRTRQPLVINERMPERTLEFNSYTLPGTGDTQSWLGVPILAGERAVGLITVESFLEQAFRDSDVRLLETLAGSLGVALENARLFNETRRLLDET